MLNAAEEGFFPLKLGIGRLAASFRFAICPFTAVLLLFSSSSLRFLLLLLILTTSSSDSWLGLLLSFLVETSPSARPSRGLFRK